MALFVQADRAMNPSTICREQRCGNPASKIEPPPIRSAKRGSQVARVVRPKDGLAPRRRRFPHQIIRVTRRPGVGGRSWYRVHTERSEEQTSELQSLMRISYAVFC